eukprot:636067-Pelagomonas_calceolata.AAC.1
MGSREQPMNSCTNGRMGSNTAMTYARKWMGSNTAMTMPECGECGGKKIGSWKQPINQWQGDIPDYCHHYAKAW